MKTREVNTALNQERAKFLSLLNLDKKIVRAEGPHLFTDEGEVYLDFTSQYGAVPFGHNPKFLWDELIHQSEISPGIMIQPFQSLGAAELSSLLIKVAPGNLKHVTLACSGAEAVETAIKMARAKTGRAGILSAVNSFHGKTMAASLATGNEYYSEPFQCKNDDFQHIPYNDLDALESALQRKTFAAFMVEPIQGEGGMIVPSKGYLKSCEQLCEKYKTLFVVDEIQVGLGRTGALFVCERENVAPDILLIAKALGGGILPISACITNDRAWSQAFGQRHSSTFANNHLTARIGLKVIQKLTEDTSIIENVKTVGIYLKEQLTQLVKDFPTAFESTSGYGFMQGLMLARWTDPESYMAGAAYEQGHAVPLVSSFLLNKHMLFTAPTLNASNVLRIQPNYLTTEAQINQLIMGLRDVGELIEDGRFSDFFRSAMRLKSHKIKQSQRIADEYRQDDLQPFGPKLGTFAFLLHPTTDLDAIECFPGGLSAFPQAEQERVKAWIKEFKGVDAMAHPTFHIPVLQSKSGGYVEGWFIGCLLQPQEMMRLSKSEKQALMDSYIEAAQSKGADVIGLGAFTSVISRSGKTVANCGTYITTGNAYTALTSTESVRMISREKKRPLNKLHLGVVGVSGSVGRLSLLDLGPECERVSLIGNARNKTNTGKLEAVAGELLNEILRSPQANEKTPILNDLHNAGISAETISHILAEKESTTLYTDIYQHVVSVYTQKKGDVKQFPIVLTNDIDTELPICDVVITATSNGEAFIRPDILKEQAIVCDVARPSDLTAGVQEARPDVIAYEGGLVHLPESIRFGRPNVVGLETGISLACLSETIILTMSQVNKSYSVGGVSGIDEAREVFDYSLKHGFLTYLPSHLQITPNVLEIESAVVKKNPCEQKNNVTDIRVLESRGRVLAASSVRNEGDNLFNSCQEADIHEEDDNWVITQNHEALTSQRLTNVELRDIVGGKAASLFELSQWGLPVPEFCCITTQSLYRTLKTNGLDLIVKWMETPSEPLPASHSELNRMIDDLTIPVFLTNAVSDFISGHPHSHFAVRSSGTLEDGSDASFAGLFETILNVQSITDVMTAIKSCWKALFDERVLFYLEEKGINSSMGLAIVVQTLVPSEKSGVLFTVDPVRGVDKEILVEACFGLGEALVSGQVTPDQYRYDWYEGIETNRVIAEKEVQCIRLRESPFTAFEPLSPETSVKAVLSLEELKVISALGLRIQEKSGVPVDIEWAKADGEFYILQSRPITQLGYAGIPGEWTTADFRDGGVSSTICTPYMASLYKSVMDEAMADYLEGLGLQRRKRKDTWQLSFYGRPYWNLEAVKHYLSQIPSFNERTFDEGLGITPNYEGDGVVSKNTPTTLVLGLKALFTIKRNCSNKLIKAPAFSEKQKLRLTELNTMNLADLDDRALFDFCEVFLTEEYFHSEHTYFDFIYDNSNLNALFKDTVQKLPFDQNDFPLLLSGLSGVSHLMPIEELWSLRDAIISQADTLEFWVSSSIDIIVERYLSGSKNYCLDIFDEYLNRFGHHSKRELDLMEPRYKENPGYVINELKSILTQTDENDPRKRNKRQQLRARVAQEKLSQSAPFWKRKQVQSSLKQVREFLWWREELRDLSTQFYFHVRRITLAVEERLMDKGILQNKNDIFFLERDELIQVMRSELSSEECRKRIGRNKSYYNSFAKFTIPDEIGGRYSQSGPVQDVGSDSGRSGVAGSSGVTTGIARVVADIDDAVRLQPGDILVTRCTDPAWTAKFSALSGVVTETGGILSHAAVICREYGMPAILAVKKATSIIKDGETITIDGNNGTIMVYDGDELVSLETRRPQAVQNLTEGALA